MQSKMWFRLIFRHIYAVKCSLDLSVNIYDLDMYDDFVLIPIPVVMLLLNLFIFFFE